MWNRCCYTSDQRVTLCGGACVHVCVTEVRNVSIKTGSSDTENVGQEVLGVQVGHKMQVQVKMTGCVDTQKSVILSRAISIEAS